MGVWYTTREAVKSSGDSKETARNNAQIDRQIEAASRSVEGLLHRKFYPEIATRYFSWPDVNQGRPWRLWLNNDELISVTTLKSAGVIIPPEDYFLEPYNSGPPYTHVELNLNSSAYFGGASTHQRSIEITGVFGYEISETPVGTLGEALDASETDIDVSNSAQIGVGDILRIGSERMLVTEKTLIYTEQDLEGTTLAQENDTSQIVADSSGFFVGEVIQMDSEKMLIVDITTARLTVKRAWDGSTLSQHTDSQIWAPRRLTVERGALGTTAATHDAGDSIVRHNPPGLIKQLCTAEAVTGMSQESAGYSHSKKDGDNERQPYGQGLLDLREQAYTLYGRKARMRSV